MLNNVFFPDNAVSRWQGSKAMKTEFADDMHVCDDG